MEPQISISPRLAEYLAAKGFAAIVVDVAECKSCGGAIAEVFARAAKPKEAERLKQQSPKLLESGGVEVILARRGLKTDEHVSFDLRNFLGLKDVTVSGIHL